VSVFHCTGYYAQRILLERFREQWIYATVGANMTFMEGDAMTATNAA
jgi:hypothetical protein